MVLNRLCSVNVLNGAPFDKLMALRKLEGQRLNDLNGAKWLNPSTRSGRLMERLERASVLMIARKLGSQSAKRRSRYAAFDVSSNSTFNRAPNAAATFSSVVNE
jgi:hypothetical protein